ncbi:MAG TPA: cytochrome b/b6 domain-containing protein [Blastocatellia bacterium]|nr:cytochrome b/b6 domain-containing protein [Blastocatellia bacterium]
MSILRVQVVLMKRHISILIVLLFLLFWAIANLTGGDEARAQVPPEEAPSPTLDCQGCHGPGKTLPYLAGALFHTQAHTAYDQGYHSKAVQDGSKAASCLDCHTVDGDMSTILAASDPASTINRANIARTCGSCHGDPSVMAGTGISPRPFLTYSESVHSSAIGRGNLSAAVCTDCHKSHDILPASDPRSPIFRFNIPQTCGDCHASITGEYNQSVHGQAAARGVSQSPLCTDCHGIHSINRRADARSTLGFFTCSQCHEGVRLTREFGVASERVRSYEDSYHGLARRLGSDVVADCASCHGVHNILPSSDPRSLIHPANLVRTCGQCHPGASQNFVAGSVHLNVPASQDIGSIAVGWVRWIYLALIGAVIGGMAAHNLLVWARKSAAKRRREERTIVRMTLRQRVQHWLLLTSFIALVISGFALAYPEGWLAWMLGYSETVRRTVHRVAAVVMLVLGVYHVAYMTLTREGRQGLKDMIPRMKDIRDFVQNVRYYLGARVSRPKFARFGYAEKAEYWAVVWGTVIMGITGLMIWFEVETIRFFPRWIIDVVTAIHFYEAVLATLAIIVWHFYHVIFDPDVYPINWAFMDGRMSEELYKEDHQLAYEELKEAEQKETEESKKESQPTVSSD